MSLHFCPTSRGSLRARIVTAVGCIVACACLRAAAAPDRKLYFEKGHAHLTPDGNGIVAETLRREIEARGWLEPWKN